MLISDYLSRVIDPGIRACVDRRHAFPRGVDRMAAERIQLWKPGTLLRIAFRGGSRLQRLAVMRAASIWASMANIRFEQVTRGTSELRCSFDPGGSWSYIGQDVLNIPPDEPTMNMGWPDDSGRDLHELGHALGLIHEHQSPAASIPWNREAAYRFYGSPPNNWSREDVDQQVFGRYDGTTITNTAWDKNSIMEYPIPAQLVTDPKYVVGWNQVLSPTDKAFIATLYPRTK
jgi:hypothetical protein